MTICACILECAMFSGAKPTFPLVPIAAQTQLPANPGLSPIHHCASGT